MPAQPPPPPGDKGIDPSTSGAEEHSPPRNETSGGLPPHHDYLAAGGKSAVVHALEKGEFEVQPSRFKDIYFPAGLLAVGVLVTFVLWVTTAPRLTAGLLAGTLTIVLEAIIFIPLTLGAVLYAARLYQLDFGPIKPALFKLGSIAVGPGSVADILFFGLMSAADADPWTLAAGFIIYVILCGAPMALIFELSLYETLLIVSLLVLPRIALVFVLGAMFVGLFLPGIG